MGVRSIGFLTWHCVSTLVGEEKMSLYSSTCLCCKERLCAEAIDVAMTFSLLWEWITKKTNFPICEITLLHCLVEINKIAVGGATFGILYNCLPILIITLCGLDSYAACCFHKYGYPKKTSQTSRGEISHNTSFLKGLMS
jgi:hypothetical protein